MHHGATFVLAMAVGMDWDQARPLAGAPVCVSVFGGRLADFGIDYRPIMRDAVARAGRTPNVEIIWTSTREVPALLRDGRCTTPLHARPLHGRASRLGVPTHRLRQRTGPQTGHTTTIHWPSTPLLRRRGH